MGDPVQRVIAVSAVNIRKGGTLTVLRSCLEYLSRQQDLRVIALVHKRSLCDYPGIEYIEIPWTVKSWGLRLWCEYVTMHGISKKLAREMGRPVDVWLSLHDTTPRVVANCREVYCQTSFPFLKRHIRDLWVNPKVFLFSIFTRFAYRINIHKNDSIIVQQEWFRDAMSAMLGVPASKFRVITPEMPSMPEIAPRTEKKSPFTFFFASTGDCHKNFETLLEAAASLEKEMPEGTFKVVLTISGTENRYTRWLYRRWGRLSSAEFAGIMKKDELFACYASADCFVFPSRIETWGLPITEYMAVSDGPLILADLPYAHETVRAGRILPDRKVSFFPAEDSKTLSKEMKKLINENSSIR